MWSACRGTVTLVMCCEGGPLGLPCPPLLYALRFLGGAFCLVLSGLS